MRQQTAQYVAVTGDLVGSSRLPPEERVGLQARLLKLMRQANREFRDDLVAPCRITLGDEFQCLLKALVTTVDMIQFWRKGLCPNAVRFGIGVGAITTRISRQSTAHMDGECFHRSRQALAQAKKQRVIACYDTGEEHLDIASNAILALVSAIQENWKPLHYRRFWLYRELRDLGKVAEREMASKQAVSESLRGAKYEAVLGGERSLRLLFSRL